MVTDQHTWESGYRPYCLRCNTMYRMTRTDFGWQCAHPDCANMIDKVGQRIKQEGDNKPDYIQHPEKLGRHGILYSMMETRYTEVGPPTTTEEFVRRVDEAARLLNSLTKKMEKKPDAQEAEASDRPSVKTFEASEPPVL